MNQISDSDSDGAPAQDAAQFYAGRPWEALYSPEWVLPDLQPPTMLQWFDETVRTHGDRPALLYFDAALSWAQVDEMSDVLAGWLADRGVVKADRVAVILQNVPAFALIVIACWKIGAIPVPSNPQYRGAELARLFSDCTPKVILGEAEQAADIQEGVQAAGVAAAVLLTRATDFRAEGEASPFLELLQAGGGRKVARAELEAGDLGLIMYTSGTTGSPRGAMIRHDSLVSNALLYARLTRVDEQARLLAAAPLFHITGYVCHLCAAIVAGASVVLPYRMQTDIVIPLIRQHRPTNVTGAITAYNALMNAPGVTADDFSSFDAVTTGGAPVPPALHAEVKARLGVSLYIGYGMTETTAPTVFTPFGLPIPSDSARGILSIGIPVPGVEISIRDDEDRLVAPGEVGELCMRGRQIMAGYWNRVAETEAVLSSDGWLRSGDIAYMNAEGWVFLVDRKKDVIIASGFKVWPTEVEDTLYAHPAVREAAVIGVPDDYRGETVKAIVSLKPGQSLEADELFEHCRRHLSGYKRPRLIEIIDDLPKTVTGKIQKTELRKQGRA